MYEFTHCEVQALDLILGLKPMGSPIPFILWSETHVVLNPSSEHQNPS